MGEITTGVNWIAVAIGAVLSFGLGALWYSPKMFGKKWMEGVRLPADHQGGMVKAMALQIAGTVLLAWVIGVMAARDAAMTTILIVLMTTALIAANGAFASKSNYAVCTESGFIVAMGVIMVACQALI